MENDEDAPLGRTRPQPGDYYPPAGWKERLSEYVEDGREATNPFRRIFCAVLRSFLNPIKDLRESLSDLRTRVRMEVGPPAPIFVQRTPTEEFHPQRGIKAVAPGVLRPVGFGESTIKQRRILIVGGMDFFGLALVQYLNSQGLRNIVLVDDLSDERWLNLPALQFDEYWSFGELNQALVRSRRSLGMFSHVYYLAGWEGDSPLTLPKALLKFLVEKNGKFISLSSASSLGINPDREDIAEDRPEKFCPVTRAGVMACLFDRFAMARVPSRNYLSLKHYRLFGPNERMDGSIYGLTKLIYEQVNARGVAELPISLHPDAMEGRRRHDFFYVRDAVSMAVFLSQCDAAGGIYELGSGSACTPIDFVYAVFEAMELPLAVEWIDAPACPASFQPFAADLSRWASVAGSEPQPTLQESVRHYVEHCLQNGNVLWEQKNSGEGPRIPEELSVTARFFPPKKKKRFSGKAPA